MKYFVGCLLMTASLQAASFAQVSCGSPLGDLVRYNETSTSSTCNSLSTPERGGASATGSVTLQMAMNPSQFSTLSTYQNAFAATALRPGDPGSSGLPAGATINIAYQTEIHTSGAERPGFLQIGPNSTGQGGRFYTGNSDMVTGFDLEPNPYRVPTTAIGCNSQGGFPGNCTPSELYFMNIRPLIPITLGTNLTLFATGVTRDGAGFFDGQSSGFLSTQFQFRFLEADGVTPVAASEVPEPATWGLIVAGLLLVRLRRLVRVKSRRPCTARALSQRVLC